MLLRRMQSLLTRLYDAPVEHDAEDFLISDPQRLREVVGEQRGPLSDEQVFVVQEDGGVRIGLFIDERVLERLATSTIRWMRSTKAICTTSARRSKASVISIT